MVLPHEHLLWDQTCWGHPEPQELGDREEYRQPVCMDNRGRVIYHAFDYRDNLVQSDVQVAVEEARLFRLAGGGTICDVSSAGLGRDPQALYRISVDTGLHVIMGAALYVAGSWTEEEKKRSPEQIRDVLLSDFAEGIGPLGTKPGILGEVGISDIRQSPRGEEPPGQRHGPEEDRLPDADPHADLGKARQRASWTSWRGLEPISARSPSVTWIRPWRTTTTPTRWPSAAPISSTTSSACT